uniref:Uncharacterized protein n=1 Tax=Ditylenchus dipsaci TaxID=166011 RepID=A0A915CXI4_9BILA
MAEQYLPSLTHEAVESICKKVLDEQLQVLRVLHHHAEWPRRWVECVQHLLLDQVTDAAFCTRWETDALVVICNVFALVVPSPEED